MIIMSIMRTVTHVCAQRFTGYKLFHIHQLINSSQQPCEVGRAGVTLPSVQMWRLRPRKGQCPVSATQQVGGTTGTRSEALSPASGPWLSLLTMLSSRRTLASIQSLSHIRPGPQTLAAVSPGSSADSPAPTWQTCPLHLLPTSSQLGGGPTPTTLPVRVGCPGRGGGAGTSFPVFLSDPSPQGKRRERRKGRKRRRR